MFLNPRSEEPYGEVSRLVKLDSYARRHEKARIRLEVELLDIAVLCAVCTAPRTTCHAANVSTLR